MTEEVKLKPCPFCRCEKVSARKDKITFHELFPWTVKCNDCYMSIGGFKTEQDAVDEWNSRPLEDAKDARIAELEKAFSAMYEEYKKIRRRLTKSHAKTERIADLERQLAEALDENKELNAANVRLGKALAEATTWRSPETAPRDKYFLALMYGRQPCVIARNAADTLWICLYSAITFEDEDGHHFTGWLPLPEPKKEDV